MYGFTVYLFVMIFNDPVNTSVKMSLTAKESLHFECTLKMENRERHAKKEKLLQGCFSEKEKKYFNVANIRVTQMC